MTVNTKPHHRSWQSSFTPVIGFLLLTFCLVSKAEPAQRIITLSPHLVELLYALGAGDRIVGTVEHSDYPESALQIERIGNYSGIQIERIVALDPDLIVTWKGGSQAADLEKLASLKLPLFHSYPQNIADIGEELLALGKLTGTEERAIDLANQLNNRYKAIKQRYRNKTKVAVFYQLWHDPFRTLGPNSWISKMIDDCNGKNIFSDAVNDYPVVSMESIVVKNPEVIIIPGHSNNDSSQQTIWQPWPHIEAVKHGRIFALPGDLLHRFTPRALDGLERLCQAIDSAR